MPPVSQQPPTKGRVLQPQPWNLTEPPPTPLAGAASPADPEAEEEPALVLLDRRETVPTSRLQHLETLLEASERRRHAAFRQAADRERFLLGRAALRLLLGAWLGVPPEAVALPTGLHGKPHCPGGPSFNLSHSGDLVLLALHPSRPVGVDVEALRADVAWEPLAQRLFTSVEQEALQACPAAEQPGAFLDLWCRLEARLKARGLGLAGLEALRAEDQQVSLAGDGSTSVRGAAESIWDVAVPSVYRAAVAMAPGRRGSPAPAG
jgi:4'-phosphopantetheinyl transferase